MRVGRRGLDEASGDATGGGTYGSCRSAVGPAGGNETLERRDGDAERDEAADEDTSKADEEEDEDDAAAAAEVPDDEAAAEPPTSG